MREILRRWRVILLVFFFFIVSGISAINQIPKEERPDISLPLIYVVITLNGISAEDSDKLLIQPLQKYLSTVSGVKKIKSIASPGRGAFTIEFNSDVRIDQALDNVQRAVNKGKKDLPADAKEPSVTEINLSLFPIISLSISGDQNELVLFKSAKLIQNSLKSLPTVLEAVMKGARDPILEIIIDPEKINSLSLDMNVIFNQVRNNNTLIAAGVVDNGSGRFKLEVPGLINSLDELSNLPIRYDGLRTLRLKDIAKVQLGFEQAKSIAYMDGRRAIILEIKKRIGSNLIQTVTDVRKRINEIKGALPSGVKLNFSLDSSRNVITSLKDLFNNIIFATILVMLVILVSIGLRNSLLVGIAIPGSFLSSLFILNTIGFTLNIVVLFALILSIGLLVDSAIVISEAASRYLSLGESRLNSYTKAVNELGLPIISSTITTLVVFLPLLFWPGVIGEFMFYLPSTLIIVLSSALIISLLVIPSFGVIFPSFYKLNLKNNKNNNGERGDSSLKKRNNTYFIAQNQFDKLKGFSAFYYKIIKKLINWPIMTLITAIGIFIIIFISYSKLNSGTIFFPKIKPESGYVIIKARGNLSISQREAIALEVNNRLLKFSELKNVYTVISSTNNRGNKDQIAKINYEFVNWLTRRKAAKINQNINKKISDIPGIVVEIGEQKKGPSGGKADINLLIQSNVRKDAREVANQIQKKMRLNPKLKDIKNNYTKSDRKWQLIIDRKKAAEFGLDIVSAARYVRMITNGLTVGSFYTDFSDKRLKIKLLYPTKFRNINQIKQIKIASNGVLISLTNFASMKSSLETGEINRTNGIYSFRVFANSKEGYNTNKIIAELSTQVKKMNFPKNVRLSFEGEAQQQAETSQFLVKAFVMAIFMMFLVLMIQFNNFYRSILVLSAIIFSTGGVLLGFMLTNQPFVIVMGGIGVIALAGVVVNNNIILISSYTQFLKENLQTKDAIIKSCLTRLRPVLLTAFTTVLGLVPMVYQINISLLEKSIVFDSPSSQWWVALSTTIAGGLSIATLITLLFVPAMLSLESKFSKKSKNNQNSMPKNTNKFKSTFQKIFPKIKKSDEATSIQDS